MLNNTSVPALYTFRIPALCVLPIPAPYTLRSPLRMQGSIAGLSVCAARASMDTCMHRYERVYTNNVGGV